MTTALHQHDALLPAVLPGRQGKPRLQLAESAERCSERYMDDVLRHISPDLKRNDGWLQTLGALIDAEVIAADGAKLPIEDKLEKLRAWSADGATYDDEQFDTDCSWFLERVGEVRERVGLGTVDQLARAGGYSGCHPSHSLNGIDAREGFTARVAKEGAKPDGLYNGPEYASRPAVRWIAKEVIAGASYTVASGRSQSGKSYCELDLHLSIICKPAWRDKQIERNGVGLWIAGEGQERVWNDACAWCAENGLDPRSLRNKFFILDRGTRLNTDKGWNKLCEVIAYIEATTGRRPLYIVFDTLRRNMRGSVSKEEDVSDVLSRVDELQQMGIAVTLIAHQGRSHDETKGQTDWEDDADQVRNYSGTVRDRTTAIEFRKIKGAADGWSVSVRYAVHSLPDGGTTLVAITGDNSTALPAATKPATSRRGTNQHTQSETLVFAMMLDNAVSEILHAYKPKHWTNNELAEALAMREDMGEVSSETLKRRTLRTLREDKTKRANKLYEPALKRWRWREK
jgi:hypothetical protein